MKNRKMQEKGITLIALVVTIIVLLILAGISISMLTGQNGILNRASQAKKAQSTSQVEELAKLKLQELYTDNLGVPDDTTVKTAIAEELRKQGYEVQNVTTSNATVKGIIIKDADGKSIDGVNIGPGATTKIRVELDVEGAGAIKTYVKINGKYYEINITGTNVSLSTEEYAEIPNGSQENQIKLTPPTDGAEMTVDGTKVTAEKVIENGTEITIKAGSETKTVTFNVKVENTLITKDVNVVVAQIAAGTAVENPASYGTNPNAQATADGAGKSFAKPDGATYVEGTVDTGVVVNIKGSEFVWVPVDDVVLDTGKDADLPKSSSAGTSSGKTYTPMAVQVGNDYKGILYNYSGSNSYLMYPSNSNYQGGSSDYREPDIVSYDTGDYKSEGITKDILTSEYNAMIASILKYKGFYVAKYEAGLDENKNIAFKDASVAENKVTTTDASNSVTYRWYGLYKKIKTFTTDSVIVVSSMIWGSQYDAMMNWMAKNGKNVGNSNSSIYNNTTTTGNKSTDVVNNVYDLYGCHYEWTLEAYSSNSRARRAGTSGFSDSPANRTSYGPYYPYSSYSSRATLCIK